MSLYLTAILPPAQVSEEIDDIRREISAKHGVFAALKPPVHITLYRPVNVPDELENHLIKLLRPVSLIHKPFELVLENFDSFNNKTLFIHPVKSPEISNLQKSVASIFNKNKIDPRELKGNTGFHPHITIAYRDVKPEVFKVLWEEFKNRKFKRKCMVEQFTLLKHDGERWNIREEYPLEKPENLSLF